MVVTVAKRTLLAARRNNNTPGSRCSSGDKALDFRTNHRDNHTRAATLNLWIVADSLAAAHAGGATDWTANPDWRAAGLILEAG